MADGISGISSTLTRWSMLAVGRSKERRNHIDFLRDYDATHGFGLRNSLLRGVNRMVFLGEFSVREEA